MVDLALLYDPKHSDSSTEYSHSCTHPPTIRLGRAFSSESDPSEDPTAHTSVHSSGHVREPPPPSVWHAWSTPVVLPSAPPVSPHSPSIIGSPSVPSRIWTYYWPTLAYTLLDKHTNSHHPKVLSYSNPQVSLVVQKYYVLSPAHTMLA
ncbi:hypothetical protein POM88_034237 [Heracleum sosnowskyi]|uniref:Uncharacterized protein n=1 Tax=Heracleum sosnowskyi TaxID=360622 RepID=A0AAD8MAD5_9APIA|nr:hypothetical protein POM88_034237 [Heracleum sosnowskyi]